MTEFTVFFDPALLEAIKVLGIALIFMYAFGTMLIYLINQYRAGNDNVLQVLDTATGQFVDYIEASPADEFLEEQYIKSNNVQLKKVVDYVLDALDPATATTPSQARQNIYRFLENTTDGDLST